MKDWVGLGATAQSWSWVSQITDNMDKQRYVQGCRKSGKLGKVREFENCQGKPGKVRENLKSDNSNFNVCKVCYFRYSTEIVMR